MIGHFDSETHGDAKSRVVHASLGPRCTYLGLITVEHTMEDSEKRETNQVKYKEQEKE